MKALTYTLFGLLLGTAPALAPIALASETDGRSDWRQLKGSELRDAYLGQTIDLVYNTVGFTKTAHHSETHHADGSTDYYEGELRLDGRWQLVGAPGFEDQLCYRYPQLDVERQHCFFIFREGNCLYNYAVRRFRTADNVVQELWRAKGANRENGPSCDIFVS